jgi:mono/diheme cytochrome c family protein
MNIRQRITAIIIALASLALASTITATATKNNAAKKNEIAAQEKINRGKYLVNLGGCNHCHTPWKMGPKGPEPDFDRQLSGHPQDLKMGTPPKLDGPWMWAAAGSNTAFSGPWGVSYAANLTPDRLTGIGIWDEKMFVKTIRSGRHWGVSRPILPPMPWEQVAGLTDDDLSAVYTYLRTLKPVRNQVPDAIVAPPPPSAPAKVAAK